MHSSDTNQVRRVEMILQQLEALPTLSPVAVRLLDLTTSEDSETRDVIRLVASDPALSSKVLRLCRCHPQGRALAVTSVERAVVLLGFDAVRSAVLSVQVMELFDHVPSPGGEMRGEKLIFDRQMFWQHSLAVAITCEMLCERVLQKEVPHGEASLSGLLHDLGQLVLHVILPASFDRVCELAESHGVSLDQACHRVIGIDAHTAGKRLAEHWHLPHSLGDVLWLHGQPYGSLPDLPHRKMIGLVSLADALVRRQHITTVGHAPRGEDIAAMSRELGVDPDEVAAIVASLHEEVHERASSIGLDVDTSTGMLLRSVSRANEVLGRLNAAMQQRAAAYETQVRALRAIAEFHAAAMPSGSVAGVLGKVVQSAASALGGNFFAMLYQAGPRQPWQLLQFATDGRLMRSDLIDSPVAATAVEDLGDDMQISIEAMAILPWLTDYLGDAENLKKVRLLPLRCGWGVSAVLLHECPIHGPGMRQQLEALSRTWAAAIAAAAQHAGAKRLGEQLADANRLLLDAQDELARTQAMAAVGEITSGAAHEMNNPLAIISGRAQLLANQATDKRHRDMARQIVESSHQLSDMITALREVSDPVEPVLQPVDLADFLDRVISESRPKTGRGDILLKSAADLPQVLIDPEQIARALHELINNAFEAKAEQVIELHAHIDHLDDRLIIQVVDQGPGLSEHALAHAFDPFFSEKPAGRQSGLGLTKARRFVEAHHGKLTLENGPSGGAVATIRLDVRIEGSMRGVA